MIVDNLAIVHTLSNKMCIGHPRLRRVISNLSSSGISQLALIDNGGHGLILIKSLALALTDDLLLGLAEHLLLLIFAPEHSLGRPGLLHFLAGSLHLDARYLVALLFYVAALVLDALRGQSCHDVRLAVGVYFY